MRTRSTLICSFSALFCASSSSISSFRLSLSSESSVSGGIPDLNQPRVMRSMPKARVKPTQTGEQLHKKQTPRTALEKTSKRQTVSAIAASKYSDERLSERHYASTDCFVTL